MGLFKSKKKTTVEKLHQRETLSKIVKLSYLQTLAIDGGLDAVKDIAGETEGSDTTDVTSNTDKSNLAKVADKQKKYLGKYLDKIGVFGKVAGLFGKKVTTDVKVDVKETGWSVTKVWNQPQFDIIRYAIGIKDLTVSRFLYEPVSEIISKPWTSPKEITKVVLNVDQFIPSIFPPGIYIKYYIKPNIEDSDFIQINPIGQPSIFNDDGSIVPRIINFNTEKPLSSKLEDVYISTSKPLTEIIFKAVLTRPDSIEGTTDIVSGYSPILRSYRILMYPKNGL